MPKVSVLVPLYNTNENHLKEMIESVLSQTFTDFEFLLLNDSPENTTLRSIVESYNDNRIVYSENPKNLGISASRNKLIEIARGEYLAIFDHDDICLPKRLELQVAYMDNHPEVGVCSGWTQEIPKNCIRKWPEDNEAIKTELMNYCCVQHSAAMIRKSTLVEHGIRYEQIYSPAEDHMLWIRLMAVTMFHNIQQPLIKYRRHQDNTTNRQREKMRDKHILVRCIALREYPYLSKENKNKYWVYLFKVIPFIQVRNKFGRRAYLLFGIFPLLSI